MILGATPEQERAVRDLMKPGCWKQSVQPPDDEGYVRCKVWGPWGTSPWYWIAPDGLVTDHRNGYCSAGGGHVWPRDRERYGCQCLKCGTERPL